MSTEGRSTGRGTAAGGCGCCGRSTVVATRRDFLQHAGLGFGSVAAMVLLHRDGLLAEEMQPANPFAPKRPPLPATATSVISLFMHGGPSHVDTFDPKPLLARLEGQRIPDSFGTAETQFSDLAHAPLLASRRTFKRVGRSGIEISDLFPHVSAHADDLAVIRSCYHDA